jgi:hypothetical protein
VQTQSGKTYTVTLDINDANGNALARSATLVAR